MSTPTDPINHGISPHPQSVAELTLALEKVIEEFAIASPQTISIFFDGTEVYRQQTQDRSVFWWGESDHSAPHPRHQIHLVSPH